MKGADHMITIDEEKCIGCMQCVQACPFMVLSGESGKLQICREKYCIKCLHCAAVCPQDAISLDGMDGNLSDEVFPISDEFQQKLEKYLLSRRSYRRFRPESVSNDIISKALKVAAWAPSAKNQHPTKWIVISGKSKIEQIMHAILEYVRETGVSPEIADLYQQGHNVVTRNCGNTHSWLCENQCDQSSGGYGSCHLSCRADAAGAGHRDLLGRISDQNEQSGFCVAGTI